MSKRSNAFRKFAPICRKNKRFYTIKERTPVGVRSFSLGTAKPSTHFTKLVHSPAFGRMRNSA